MGIRAIHQILPALLPGDAIGGQAVLLDRIWRGMGVDTRLYAAHASADAAMDALDLEQLPRTLPEDEIAVYHHSIGCPAADLFCALRGNKIVVYHNITPPALLVGVPHLAAKAQQGLDQLRSLARCAMLGVADSEFNRRDLLKAGLRQTTIAHLALDDEKRQTLEKIAANRKSAQSPAQTKTLLYVGRIVPHKRIEDLLRILAIVQSSSSMPVRLRIIGDSPETPKYVEALHAQIAEGKVRDVEFVGKKIGPSLTDEYAQADVYVCASAHEGFCLPLLESMTARLPVVTFAAGAIIETMAGTGLVIPNRDPFQFAEAIQIILSDAATRSRLAAAQEQRANDFSAEKLAGIWKMVLTSEARD